MTKFSGSIVAIVTPMNDDGSLDIAGLKRLIDWHVAEGTDGIVIVGLALFLIGWIGVFFGRMIKAAVSREREYLADAGRVLLAVNIDDGRLRGRVDRRHAEGNRGGGSGRGPCR